MTVWSSGVFWYRPCLLVVYCKGQGWREEGKPRWAFRAAPQRFKTKDLGFNSGRNQNGPKFIELQKSSRETQYTGSVPACLPSVPRRRCRSPQTLPGSFGAAGVRVFPPTPLFLTGVTQSGKRIKIVCRRCRRELQKRKSCLPTTLQRR